MSEFGEQRIQGQYFGQKAPLFKLAFVTALLTLVTLGIYRFWAKTRIRKYIWSSAEGGESRFEYTGTGLEKFLGFLIAVVILAIYLGLVQMALFYFGLNIFKEPENEIEMFAQLGATYITFFAITPFILFASYRSTRYKLSRTRWRGIRFGMDKAALGYVWRGLLHGLLSIVTLGIMYPRQVFYLQKYKVDRSWFGDARFEQNGKWTKLYPGMLYFPIAVVVIIAGTFIGNLADSPVLPILSLAIGYVWFLVGMVIFRLHRLRYMTSQLALGDVRFTALPKNGAVLKVLLLAGLGIAFITLLIFAGVFSVFTSVMMDMIGPGGEMQSPPFSLFLLLAVGYLLAMAFLGALSLAWITQPILDHIISSVTVHNVAALDQVRQREGDSGADAEGFADALDFGGV